MKHMITTLLRQYGKQVQLRHGEEITTVKGFFQPVRSRSQQNMLPEAASAGQICRGQYVFIGSPEIAAGEGDGLVVDGVHYCLHRCEYSFYGDEAVYFWGLCARDGEDTA